MEMLPHADAAFNFARWLTKNDEDAKDVVQESYIRAWRFLDSFEGDSAKSWLLKIVRNTCFTWLQKNRQLTTGFNEQIHSEKVEHLNAESLILQEENLGNIKAAIESIAPEYREVIIMREFEDLSYKEIAAITELPMGTIMSRISRGRSLILEFLKEKERREGVK